MTDNENPIRHCEHCNIAYDWHRSASSSLKMTYCGTLCERAALGFTIDALLTVTRDPMARERRAATVALVAPNVQTMGRMAGVH